MYLKLFGIWILELGFFKPRGNSCLLIKEYL